jgi:peptidyl-dipeptidase A
MNKVYSTAKVASLANPKKLLSLEPELTEIFAQSRDPKELEYYWNEWRKATGVHMRDNFIEHISLTNEAARYGPGLPDFS